MEVVADKGYESREDIENCVMNGIIPNVAFKYDIKTAHKSEIHIQNYVL